MSDSPTRLAAIMSSATSIVFDKDGTLVDLDARWAPYFFHCVEYVAEQLGDTGLVAMLNELIGLDIHGLVPDGPAAVDTAGRIGDRVVGALVARGHDREAGITALIEASAGAEYGPLEPLGDVAGALRHLHVDGLFLGIATSDGRSNTLVELDSLGIGELIDAIRCGDDARAVKPDPSVLTGIAAECGCSPGEVVFVGDSRQDLATAVAAGTQFVARCAPGRVPTWVTDNEVTTIFGVEELVLDG
jgi:phosphoglycolate phosphatase